jgi:hypothetical protein
MLRAAKCNESVPTARRGREHLPASNNGARDTRGAWAQPPSGVSDRLGSLSATVRKLAQGVSPMRLRR